MAQPHSVEQLNYDCKVHDFMRWSTPIFIFSGLLLIASVIIISMRGLNFGLDFTGGFIIEITLEKPTDLDILRDSLKKSGLVEAQIQNFGNSRDVIVRLPPKADDTGQKLGQIVTSIINQASSQSAIMKRIEFVGPNVGSDLLQVSTMALLAALIFILVYLNFRFEWRLAISAVLALLHDVIITLGILVLFRIEIDLTMIASLMSVIGYSLNDSIVVFDRIRENFRKIHSGTLYEIINFSLTQILKRTIITSATTLMVTLILLIFGGTLLRGFSLTMLIGVSIGTISSIYVASALAVRLGIKREHMLQHKVEKEGADQPYTLP